MESTSLRGIVLIIDEDTRKWDFVDLWMTSLMPDQIKIKKIIILTFHLYCISSALYTFRPGLQCRPS